jgi:hypothetical protein
MGPLRRVMGKNVEVTLADIGLPCFSHGRMEESQEEPQGRIAIT